MSQTGQAISALVVMAAMFAFFVREIYPPKSWRWVAWR